MDLSRATASHPESGKKPPIILLIERSDETRRALHLKLQGLGCVVRSHANAATVHLDRWAIQADCLVTADETWKTLGAAVAERLRSFGWKGQVATFARSKERGGLSLMAFQDGGAGPIAANLAMLSGLRIPLNTPN